MNIHGTLKALLMNLYNPTLYPMFRQYLPKGYVTPSPNPTLYPMFRQYFPKIVCDPKPNFITGSVTRTTAPVARITAPVTGITAHFPLAANARSPRPTATPLPLHARFHCLLARRAAF